ncbi:MAG: metalloregulator ArsR/SmtB family transcription factor [Alphaproteobacteria bacterium]|nr:metalloregulator ArsR/SmtB family transcription factor [Alphaproteobacteria bacterium]
MTDVFQALAHPVRRAVLKKLKAGPMSAGELAKAFPVSKPTMSRHFAALKEAGLIRAERVGTTIRYRLNVSVADEAIAAVMGLLGRGQADETQEDEDDR